jgi:hypothetical protein
VREDHKVHRDLPVRKERKVHLHQVVLALPVRKVFKDHLVLRVLLIQHLARKELVARKAHQDLLDLRGVQVLLVVQVQLARKEHRVRKDQLDRLIFLTHVLKMLFSRYLRMNAYK